MLDMDLFMSIDARLESLTLPERFDSASMIMSRHKGYHIPTN